MRYVIMDRSLRRWKHVSAVANAPRLRSWGGLAERSSPGTAVPGRRYGSRTAARRGAVLVVVLVCLAIAAAMFVVLVKLAAAGRQSMQTQCWRMQAQWLAESGLERAAARLAADSNYTNETWTLAAEELGGDAGVVRIRTEAVADQPNRRLVSVEADYPDDPQHRVRCNKQIVVDVHRTIGGTL